MHARADHHPEDAVDSVVRGARQLSTESNWLHYLRLLGTATTIGIATGTVLHQLQCELSQQPTHWLVAIQLVFVCGLATAALLPSKLSKAGFSLPLLVASITVLLPSVLYVELCELHRTFASTLLALCGTAVWLLMLDRYFGNRTSRGKDTHLENSDPLQPQSSDLENAAAVEQTEFTGAEHLEASSVDSRSTWAKHAWWILLVLCFVIYMIIVPAIGMVIDWFTPPKGGEIPDMTLGEAIRLHTISGVIMFIFLSIGASIGSFLNVVIYRLPRSMPLLWPPSSCANCRTQLSGKDNIPILAWLQLGGRCRYCQTKLSARYPLIETLFACVFILFFYRELLSGGQNLPVRPPNFYNGIVWILFYTKWDLVTIYLFHMLVFSLLLTVGMINYDRFRVPRVHAIGFCVLVFALASAFGHLNPINRRWDGYLSFLPTSLETSLIGCVGGLVLGLVADKLFRPSRTASQALPVGTDVLVDAIDEQHMPGADQANENQENENACAEQDAVTVTVEEPATDAYGVASSSPSLGGDAMLCMALVGATFGIQAAAIIGGAACVLACLFGLLDRFVFGTAPGRQTLPPALAIFATTVLLLPFWDSVYRLINGTTAVSPL